MGRMIDNPSTAVCGMVAEKVHPSGVRIKRPGVIIKINGEVAIVPENAYAPNPGEHDKEILGGILGLSDEGLRAYEEKETI